MEQRSSVDRSNKLQIREELGDTEVDIEPTLHQMDSHYRTYQMDTIVKKESAVYKTNVDATLCSGVESIWIELNAAVDEQKCARTTPTPACVASVKIELDVCVKEEPVDTNLDIGPNLFQPMDSSQGTNQQNTSVLKRDDLIVRDVNNPMLCNRVEKETVVDKPGDSKPRSYTCDICQKTFAIKKSFKYHITYVHASKSYKCDQCNKAFRCERNLKLHKGNMHSTDSNKKCNVCGKHVKLRNLKQHMVKMHSNKQRLCNLCGETFKLEQYLHLHQRDVHGKQPPKSHIYICDYCRRTFSKKYTMKHHIMHVHAKGYYECNQCKKFFKCEQYLMLHKSNMHTARMKKCNICGTSLKPLSMRRHMLSMHSDKQLQCYICGEKIKSKYYFKQHMNEHRGQPSTMVTGVHFCQDVALSEQRVISHVYSCDKCEQTFYSRDTFRQHNKLAHSTEPSSEHNECNKEFTLESYFYKHTSRDGKLQYECAVCKKMYKSKAGLRGHVTNHHRPRPTGADANVYICDYCLKMFGRKQMIIDHISSVHAGETYKCNQCGKSYRSKQNLQRHKGDIHTAVLHKCNICSKFISLRGLKDHMRNKHSGKKLQCKICGEIMLSKQGLHDHLNDIHGQQSITSPFVNRCGYCQKIYTSKKGLKAHIKYLHGKDIHRCSECNAIFKSKEGLRRHMKSVHSKKKCEDSNKQSTCSKLREESGKSTNPAVGDMNVAASTSAQQLDVVAIKQEPVDEGLELGPVMFQHMDCNYRPYKQEPLLD